MDGAKLAVLEHGRHFRLHVEAEVLQHRNGIRQRQAAFCLVKLQPQAGRIVAFAKVQARPTMRSI